jgi:hypothetical protein
LCEHKNTGHSFQLSNHGETLGASKLKMGGAGRAKVTGLSDESVAKARGIREQFEREFAALG